jgi:hypothetical protein
MDTNENELQAVQVPRDESASAMLDRLGAAAAGVDAGRRAERRAAAEAIVRPLIEKLQGAMSQHGGYQARWRDRVADVAARDWPAILRATPADLQFVDNRMVSANHEAIYRLRDASKTAYDVLASQYGDVNQGRDLDPSSAPRMIAAIEAMLNGDATHDPATGEFSASFKRGIMHLRWWTEKIVALAESTKSAVEAFKSAEAHAAEVLANVEAANDIEAKRRAVSLPKVENPPQSTGSVSTFTDWNPLTGEILTPKPDATLTKLDVGGARIKTKGRTK